MLLYSAVLPVDFNNIRENRLFTHFKRVFLSRCAALCFRHDTYPKKLCSALIVHHEIIMVLVLNFWLDFNYCSRKSRSSRIQRVAKTCSVGLNRKNLNFRFETNSYSEYTTRRLIFISPRAIKKSSFSTTFIHLARVPYGVFVVSVCYVKCAFRTYA